MKEFLLQLSVFMGICSISCFAIFSLADGSTDAIYLKFTTPKQSSLIVGSSRAAQALNPNIIQDEETDTKLYNYAFTIAHSAYGKSYYNSIEKKINKQSKDGLFLVCVNPWTISSMTENTEDSLHFRERGSFIEKTHFVTMKPNVEYLIESFKKMNIDILINKRRKGEYQTFYVHDNGWLEVTIESDMISKADRTSNKIASYKKRLKTYSGLSQNRMYYLKKTIELLKDHGRVYLVRLPVHNDMLKLEQQLTPNFDDEIQVLSEYYQIEYINAIPLRQQYQYTDGNHLDITSGKAFSKYLADQIKKQKH